MTGPPDYESRDVEGAARRARDAEEFPPERPDPSEYMEDPFGGCPQCGAELPDVDPECPECGWPTP